MATLSDRVSAVAQSLIAAAGMAHAVAATDIKNAAESLHKQYADYSKVDISTKIANEIKRSHSPGISGSV